MGAIGWRARPALVIAGILFASRTARADPRCEDGLTAYIEAGAAAGAMRERGTTYDGSTYLQTDPLWSVRGAIGAAYHMCDPDGVDAQVIHVGPMVDLIKPVHSIGGGEATFDTRVAGGPWRLGARMSVGVGRMVVYSIGARAVLYGHLTFHLDALYGATDFNGGPNATYVGVAGGLGVQADHFGSPRSVGIVGGVAAVIGALFLLALSAPRG